MSKILITDDEANIRLVVPSLPLAKNFFKDQAKKLRNLLDFF